MSSKAKEFECIDLEHVNFLSLKGYSYSCSLEIIELNLELIEKSKVFPIFSFFSN
jgi:hypothetical protein